MKFKGFVSDMDGTIVDSERYGFEGIRNFLRKNGVELTKEDYRKHLIGRTMDHDIRILKMKYQIKMGDDEILGHIKRHIAEAESANGGLKLNIGYLELLNLLKRSGAKISLSSSTAKNKIEFVLNSTGVRDFFHVAVSAEEVGSKAAAYLHAVKSMGLLPHECFALEDTPMGARAAKEAGLYCVVIPSEFTVGEDFSFVDEVHSSIPEFLRNGKVFNGVKI